MEEENSNFTEAMQKELLEGQNLYERGSNLFLEDEIDEALVCLEKSLDIFSKYGFKIGIFFSLDSIGRGYLKQKNFNKALVYFEKAVQLGDTLNNDKVIEGVENLKKTVYLIKEMQGKESAIKDKMQEFSHYLVIANNNLKMKNYDEALKNFEIVIDLAEKIGDEENVQKLKTIYDNIKEKLKKKKKGNFFTRFFRKLFKKGE